MFKIGRALQLLNRHAIFTLIISSIYYACVVLLHEEVSKVSVWIQKTLSIALYNKLLTISGIPVLAIFSVFMLNEAKKDTRWKIRVFCLLFTIALMVISYRTLLVVNVESIHFPQYALLSIFVFALTLSPVETILWVTLFGAIDEAYQYFILYPEWKYFDLNDVVLNLIGGGMGITLIITLLKNEQLSSMKRRISRFPVITVSLFLVIFLLFLSLKGYIQVYPDDTGQKIAVLLNRVMPPSSFWVELEWGKRYHILSHKEALVIISVLTGIYGLFGFRLYKR